ncbi:MAG: peptide deformylase [Anaerolineae bacterium]|jgi:peptide deformylase|nr:peptide deformylase [Anaerolineae bacterium]
MSILPIIQPDNPVLRKKAVRVTTFDDKKFQQLIDDMVETLIAAPGVGLAAPQVAVSQRLIVVRLPDASEEDRQEYGPLAGVVHVFANPKIIKASKEMVKGVEGCLSLPGYLGEVERHKSVVVTGQDRQGKDIRIKADGWFARVFQHEIDHLEGVLFTDRTEKVWRSDGDEKDEA